MNNGVLTVLLIQGIATFVVAYALFDHERVEHKNFSCTEISETEQR